MTGLAILRPDWTWMTLDHLLRYEPATAWVFRSRRGADRARRTYGQGAWRAMEIVKVTT